PTSFIGSRCQGIHHAPFITYKHKNQSVKKIAQNKHTTHQGSASASMLATTIQLPNTTPHHQVRQQHPHQPATSRQPLSVVSGPNSVSGFAPLLLCTQPAPTT